MQTAKLWKLISGLSLTLAIGCTTPIGAAISQKIPGAKTPSNNNNNQTPKEGRADKKADKNGGAKASAAPLDMSAGTPYLSYQSLFAGMSIAEKTGEVSFGALSILNFPMKEQSGGDADYSKSHKIELVVKHLDKDGKLKKEAWRTSATPIYQGSVASLNFNNPSFNASMGNHSLELLIDGKSYPLTSFFVKKGSKDGNTRYFLSDPWGAWSSLKLTEEGNDFFGVELGFYHAFQTMEDKDGNDGNDVIAKLYNDDTDAVIATNLNTSGGLYSKRKWSVLQLSFYDANDLNQKYKGSKLLATNGNYSLRVRLGKNGSYDETYVYKFSIKDKKLLPMEDFPLVYDRDGYSKIDMVWIKGDKQGAVKTEGFVETLKENIKENIAFAIGNTGCRPPKVCAIKDGDIVGLGDMVLDDKLRDKTKLQDITCTLTLKQKGAIIAQHNWEQSCDDSGCNQLYIDLVSNPTNLIFKNQTTAFVETLSKLPAGSQKLTLVAEIAFGKTKAVVGYSNFTFTSTSGNPKYTELSTTLKKRVNMSEAELNAEFWEKFGGPDVVTFANNCKRSVWLRKSLGSDKAEVFVAAGDTFRYDMNDGYLEQWNFGSGRWALMTVPPEHKDVNVNICR